MDSDGGLFAYLLFGSGHKSQLQRQSLLQPQELMKFLLVSKVLIAQIPQK